MSICALQDFIDNFEEFSYIAQADASQSEKRGRLGGVVWGPFRFMPIFSDTPLEFPKSEKTKKLSKRIGKMDINKS